MRFEESNYYSKLPHKKIVLPIGSFYFLNKILISEINQGAHFNWEFIESTLIPIIIEHYGEDVKIAYISNRVNSYSYDPNSWVNFEKDYSFLIASAVVSYDQMSKRNSDLDKKFSKKSLKRCYDLDDAIKWVLSLKELNQIEIA